MPMRSRGTWSGAEAAPITAEGATLPVIRAAGFEVRVNAFVVGETRRATGGHPSGPNALSTSPAPGSAPPPHALYTVSGASGPNQSAAHDRSPGCPGVTTDLWYLSLTGARGQGTTLRALWANLVSNRARSVWLEGVGSVALGQHRLDLAQLGYPIHWTFRQGVVGPGREMQGVLEADALTCYDPLLAPTDTRRSRERTAPPPGQTDHTAQTGGAGRVGRLGRSRVAGGALTLSTHSGAGTAGMAGMAGTGGSDGAAEAAAREARPLFLLLIRSGRPPIGGSDAQLSGSEDDVTDRDAILAKQHLRFLSTRIAWLPYYPRWAAYLWERAREHGEAERLRVWCYAPPKPETTGTSDGEHVPGAARPLDSRSYLIGAYLCRPDPLALTADLQRAIRSGVFRAQPVDSAAEHAQSANTAETAA